MPTLLVTCLMGRVLCGVRFLELSGDGGGVGACLSRRLSADLCDHAAPLTEQRHLPRWFCSAAGAFYSNEERNCCDAEGRDDQAGKRIYALSPLLGPIGPYLVDRLPYPWIVKPQEKPSEPSNSDD